MRNLKKFLALLLAFMMTMSLMVTVNASNIDKLDGGDEVTPQFEEAINVLLGMGVLRGSDDGGTPDIKPKANITRAEVATMLYRLYSGDVTDSQSNLYKGYCDQFSDVEDHWASGYIGYCATRNLVRGGDGVFRPQANITGHEALVMVLRAMGYDQLGEYTGNAEWRQNAALDGQRYGLLANVNESSYAGSLSQLATRELVCELIFQAATHPMVDKNLTLGNRYIEMNSVTGNVGETLGQWRFGLTGKTGIIVGNQSTGEVATKIGFPISVVEKDMDGDGTEETLEVAVGNATGITATAATLDPAYFYASDVTNATHVTLSFLDNKATPDTTKLETAKTGLEQFNHKVTVWYDKNGTDGTAEVVTDSNSVSGSVSTNLTTYAIIDKANPNMVVVDDSNSNAGGADIGSYNTNVAVENLGEILAGKGYNVPSTTGTKALYNYAFAPMENATNNYGDNDGSWLVTNSKASPVKRNDGDKLNTRDNHELYLIISNTTDRVTGKPNVDVVISLEMTITNIIEDNDYQSPLSFGVGNSNRSDSSSNGNVHFGNGGGLTSATDKDIVTYDTYKSYLNIARDHLLSTDPSTLHEDDKVAVLAIAGTNGRLPGDTPIPSYSFASYALGNAPKATTPKPANWKYDLSANQFYYQINKLTKTVTGTVKYIYPNGDVQIDRGNGGAWETVPKSVFAEATDATFAGTRERGVHDMRNNETYDFYLDSEGNWLFYERSKETPDVFVYTTYMDWQTGFVSSRFHYGMSFVNTEGKVESNEAVTEIDKRVIGSDILPYANIVTPRREDASNQYVTSAVVPGIYRGYLMNGGKLTTITSGVGGDQGTGFWQADANNFGFGSSDGKTPGVISITKDNVTMGIVEIGDRSQTTLNSSLAFTNDTKFYIVSGTGYDPSADGYTTVKEMKLSELSGYKIHLESGLGSYADAKAATNSHLFKDTMLTETVNNVTNDTATHNEKYEMVYYSIDNNNHYAQIVQGGAMPVDKVFIPAAYLEAPAGGDNASTKLVFVGDSSAVVKENSVKNDAVAATLFKVYNTETGNEEQVWIEGFYSDQTESSSARTIYSDINFTGSNGNDNTFALLKDTGDKTHEEETIYELVDATGVRDKIVGYYWGDQSNSGTFSRIATSDSTYGTYGDTNKGVFVSNYAPGAAYGYIGDESWSSGNANTCLVKMTNAQVQNLNPNYRNINTVEGLQRAASLEINRGLKGMSYSVNGTTVKVAFVNYVDPD